MASFRVLTVRPAPQAHIVLGALRAEGLDAYLERDSLGAVYGLTSGAFATRVLVAADHYDDAEALLRAIERTPLV